MDRVTPTVRAIGRRLGLQALLAAAGLWLTLGLGLAALLALAERLLATGLGVAWLAAGPVLLGGVVAGLRGLARWPGLAGAALAADARLGLDERLSTALASCAGPMARLVRADAARHAAAIEVRRSFPLRWPPLAKALPLLAVALLVVALIPSLDLLGWRAARQRRAARRAAVARAMASARERLRDIAAAARRRGLARSAQAVDDAAARLPAAAGTPQEARTAASEAESELQAKLRAAQAREEADREADVLRRGLKAVAQCRRQIERNATGPGAPAHPGAGDKNDTPPAPTPRAAPFVREPTLPVAPPDAEVVRRRLVEAGRGALDAARAGRIPWRYRAVVRRYFSADRPARPAPQPTTTP